MSLPRSCFQALTFGLLLVAACGPVTSTTDAAMDTTMGDAIADAQDRAPMDVIPDVPVDAPPVIPIATWSLPRSGPNAFALPWPSDLTLTPQGYADLRYVPNPANNSFVATYESAVANRINGFSPVGATYFRFTVPVDTNSLPDSAAVSVMPNATAMIVDVDPMSPDRGTRRPAQFYFRAAAGRYWTPNTLAIAPAFGFPLRPRTQYAVVVTDRVVPAAGGTFMRDADFAAMMSGTSTDPDVMHARALHEPALAALDALGLSRDHILSLAVFTTQDPTAETFRAVAVTQTSAPMPGIVDIHQTYNSPEFSVYTGHYGPSPIFQTGAMPYTDTGTGDFTLDAMGNPTIQGEQNITFGLSLPAGEPPAGGWPVIVYADGTGSNAMSFVGEGIARDFAAQGIAVFSFDQIFNGDRIVGMHTTQMAETEFFNFQNPLAGRSNNRQAAIDLVQAGRLVTTVTIPGSVTGTTAAVHFDPQRVMFFGHSQGGLCGPLWLAAEPLAGAAILSGAGATLSISLVEKTEPVNIPQLMAVVLGVPTSDAAQELVSLNPVLTLAQTVADVADPINYARYIVREPRADNIAHHVFQTQGFIDHYAPPDSIGSLALGIGLQLIDPVLYPVQDYPLTGLMPGMLPFQLNLAGGTVTGGWQQFNSLPTSDGHFVIYDIPAARMRAINFLGSYAHDPARIPTIM